MKLLILKPGKFQPVPEEVDATLYDLNGLKCFYYTYNKNCISLHEYDTGLMIAIEQCKKVETCIKKTLSIGGYTLDEFVDKVKSAKAYQLEHWAKVINV